MSNPQIKYSSKRVEKYLDTPDYVPTPDPSLKKLDRLPHYTTFPFRKDNKGTKTFLCILAAALFLFLNGKRFRNLYNENKVFIKLHFKSCNMFSFHYANAKHKILLSRDGPFVFIAEFAPYVSCHLEPRP